MFDPYDKWTQGIVLFCFIFVPLGLWKFYDLCPIILHALLG